MKIQRIEEFMLECIRRRDFAEVRRLLIEGVAANAGNGELLLSAARCGCAAMIRLLFAYGALVPACKTLQMLGLTVAAASPDALREVMSHLDASALQAALRGADHAVIVIAGDVRAKARNYRKTKLKLNESQIMTRDDFLLGDAARYAHCGLGERAENLWPGVVKRSEECARILLEAFVPLCKRDHAAVASWLLDHPGSSGRSG